VASLTGARTTGITTGAALALTIAASSIASAQIIVSGGYPYPAYRYADRDASVRFDVKPKDTGVYVDGYFAGIVDDFDGTFQRLRTVPGGHEITLYLEGYRTHTERVYLTIDNTLKIRHRMERLAAGERSERPPAPKPPEYQQGQPGPFPGEGGLPPRGPVGRRGPGPGPRGPGDQPPTSLPQGALPPGGPADASGRGTLSLSVQPSDAEVLVDGTPWNGAGQDRLTLDLSEGRHNIQIRKRGFVGYLTDVQVRPGETTNLEVRLKTQPQ
jgi:hypothetical protein